MTRVEDPAAPVRRAATKLLKGGRDESTDGPHNNSLIQGISREAGRGNCTCASILHRHWRCQCAGRSIPHFLSETDICIPSFSAKTEIMLSSYINEKEREDKEVQLCFSSGHTALVTLNLICDEGFSVCETVELHLPLPAGALRSELQQNCQRVLWRR